jgi:feruloyl esterase
VVLHGCGQNAKSISELSGWNKIAKQHDFVVVYPQQKLVNNPSGCFNWFNVDDIEKGKGESESIAQMIAHVKTLYTIDTNQIFTTGLSAGASMSLVMAVTHPEIFKSVAMFAGGAYKLATNPSDAFKAMTGKIAITQEELIAVCQKQNPQNHDYYPQLIIYQGLDDGIVNPKNAQLIINQWAGIYKIDTIPDIQKMSFSGIDDITRLEYQDANQKTVIIYYEVKNLGHQLMINPGENENEGGRLSLFGIRKGFHSTYQTALDFGLIKKLP